ncbi:hypothetical protein EVAR_48162_1 [Eumeta japonica]|uniref:Integrase catalytic domain-containing protein n=1 Tax=Eumeta variegata TaxID=151549 RepID=A0A4C1WRD5_EUMVA|nr:hypothetical protein EVAR_48162_1 [Eumeta japonica]
MTSQKYFWPSMNADIAKWTKSSIHFRKNKMQRHTSKAVSNFPPSDRFQYVHIDIVGSLPTTDQRHRYVITMIDRQSKWPEAIPTNNVTENVAHIVYQHWIAKRHTHSQTQTDIT